MANSNALISFLASYGPQASSNNMYDEFVANAAAETGCTPLDIPQPLIAELSALLLSSNPVSIILTGTAGDGKTYTARKILERISDRPVTWSNTQKVFKMALNGRELRFIKDLSELKETEKDQEFPDVVASLSEPADVSSPLYVICVNDGHLLKFFRDREGEKNKFHRLIAEMLRTDQFDGGSFRLYNMSRRSHKQLVNEIIDEITTHEGWKDCDGCIGLSKSDQLCPIRVNRDLLQGAANPYFRQRLNDLVRIAAADGFHLSVRQLILLVVNIILGESTNTSRVLMSCGSALKRSREGAYDKSNPYINALGGNLAERKRKRYAAFAVLEQFSIGQETNNYFDHALLSGSDSFPEDQYYGETLFSAARAEYIATPAISAAAFVSALLTQRRRLFFSMPSSIETTDTANSPWNLSVFKYGDSYLRFADHSVPGARVPASIARKLLLGLNRIMSGRLTDSDQELWLIEPSGVFNGHATPLVVARIGRRQQMAASGYIQFPDVDEDGGAPLLRVTFSEARYVDLILRPSLFEYMIRIANGALPASFSDESHLEIKRFQLKLVAEVNRDTGPLTFPEEVKNDDGQLTSRPIAILHDEDVW